MWSDHGSDRIRLDPDGSGRIRSDRLHDPREKLASRFLLIKRLVLITKCGQTHGSDRIRFLTPREKLASRFSCLNGFL